MKKNKLKGSKAAIAASDEYEGLENEYGDWIELKWYDYNDELRKAFIAGWKAKKKHDKLKNKNGKESPIN